MQAMALLIKGGELLADYKAVCPVEIWDAVIPQESLKRQLYRRIFGGKPEDPKRKVEAVIAAFNPDIIYANTAASHLVAHHLSKFCKAKLISHIHELSFSLNAYFSQEMNSSITAAFSSFITVSQANRDALVNEFSIPAEKINVVNEVLDIQGFSKTDLAVGTLRAQWKLDGYLIVGASGMPGWRKGFDLFLETAAKVSRKKHSQKIAFVWVGKVTDYDRSMVQYQSRRLGIDIPVVLTGQLTAPAGAYQDFDVFYLSSREDPFPLVCMEAAALGKPTICFENAGGMPEFVGKGGGWIVPYEDTDAVSQLLIQLPDAKNQLEEKGAVARAQIETYDLVHGVEKIWNIIR